MKYIAFNYLNKTFGFQHGYLRKQDISNCNIPISFSFWTNWPLERERTFQIAEKFMENQEQVTQTSLNSPLFFFLSKFVGHSQKTYSELKPLSYKVY